MRDVAVVGGGLAGLVAYATLRHGGVEDITVFDAAGRDPAAAWRRRAEAIRQRRMRSESDGHCLPTSFPGLAVRAALRGGSPWPLVQSVWRGYHPTVGEFLEHVDEVRLRVGWDDAVVERRVAGVTAVDGGFEIDGTVFGHVLARVAGIRASTCRRARGRPSGRPRLRAARVRRRRRRRRRRHGGCDRVGERARGRRAGHLGSAARPRAEAAQRPAAALLASRSRALPRSRAWRAGRVPGGASRAVVPAGPRWDEPLERAGSRFRVAAEIERRRAGDLRDGLPAGFRADPLLARLVAEHALATHGPWIVLDSDCTVPGVTTEERTLALAGVAAQWAFPGADTLIGAKYAAHGFLRRVAGMSYTLRGRVDSRLFAALGARARGGDARARDPPLVAGRDRRR